MTTHTATIIQLEPARWREYKDLRLQALSDAPQEFGTTLAEAKKYLDKKWRESLALPTSILWFAEVNGKVVGMVGVYWGHGATRRHVANMFGMYVVPDYRKQGIGARLLSEVINVQRADTNISKIKTEVVGGNTAATKLYEQHGFEIIGSLFQELCYDGTYYNLILMEQLLD